MPGDFDGVGNDFDEPPPPSIFGNLTGVSKIMHQPGDIKYDYISYKYVGNFRTLRKKMNQQLASPPARLFDGYGRSGMIAVEELIRTPNGNKIVLQYEREYICSAWLKTKKSGGWNVEFSKDADPEPEE